MNDQKKKIYNLEVAIANRSIIKADEVIADDFIEFGCSGNIYTKDDYLNTLNMQLDKFEYQISDFKLKRLNINTLLATYKSVHYNKIALRSSIWQSINGTWKMIFHQGIGTDK